MRHSMNLVKVVSVFTLVMIGVASCSTLTTTHSPTVQTSTPRSLDQQHLGDAQLVTSTAIGSPVANDRYVFWIDARNPQISNQKIYQNTTVYGFDALNQKEFVVSKASEFPNRSELVADGGRVAWTIWSDAGQVIQSYSVASNQIVDVARLAAPAVNSLFIDKDTLYYVVMSGGSSNLIAYNLNNGKSQLVRSLGNVVNFFVRDEVLIWHEDMTSDGIGSSALYMASLTNPSSRTLIRKVQGDIYGYTMLNNSIIYGCACYNGGIYVYNVITKATSIYPANIVSKPVSNSTYAAWMSTKGSGQQQQINMVRIEDIGDVANKVFTTTTFLNRYADVVGFVSNDKLAFTSKNEASMTRSVYLITSTLVSEGTIQDDIHHPEACDGRPRNCGQVVAVEDELRDYNTALVMLLMATRVCLLTPLFTPLP